jgi:hypothetical protein
MNPKLKKFIIITLILIVSALIGLGIYWILTKTSGSINIIDSQNNQENTSNNLPSAGDRTTTEDNTAPTTTDLGRGNITTNNQTTNFPTFTPEPTVKQIVDKNVSYPSSNQNGAIRYYDESSGKFYKLGNDGQLKSLSDQSFYNVSKVTWALNNDKAVIEYPDSSKIIYNFEQQKQTTLPKHWEDFSFSKDSSQVAAKSIGLSPENRWLVTVKDDGSGTKLVESLGDNADKVTVSWSPSNQTVAFSQTGQALGIDRNEVLFIGLNNENFKSAVVEGNGFLPEWSPTGQRLLYSVYSARSNFKPELWVTDAYGDSIGNNRKALSLNTWADKCAFSDEYTLYCAVPKDLPQGAGILPEVAAGTTDDFYKIDLKTGIKNKIDLGGDYAIKDINYDKTKNKIFFTDQTQRGVFEVKI